MKKGMGMKKLLLGLAALCGAAFAQTPLSKLNGKTVYLHRQFVDGGHANGFNALRTLLEANATAYGYKFELSVNPLTQGGIDQLFNRLYKDNGKPEGGIDVLIFCQGEGDWNVTGEPLIAGSVDRMAKVNAHVRNGGGLIISHAAGGRQISRSGWTYGAKLMTDWFMDEYSASASIAGNGGHFSSGTQGTLALDEETLKEKDPSAFFVRNLMLAAKDKKGYAMPVSTDQVRGEWYHFNGGFRYEDGTGGAVASNANKFPPAKVRGHMGHPDSGIGPAKIFSVLTKIQGANYTPPGKGRHAVWGREVSKGPFSTGSSDKNGRFIYFNPGHAGDEYTLAGGWVGNLYLSTLRWVVKDDRGCTDATRANFSALATVDDGTCLPTAIGHDALLDAGAGSFGRVSVREKSLEVSVEAQGPHSVLVTDVSGKLVYQRLAEGAKAHKVEGLQRGFYVASVKAGGQAFKKLVSIQ